MSDVMVTGISVLDFIFRLESMPREPQKFRASEAAISGGGIAANAAVAISRLGGEATLVSRIGDDEVGNIIKEQLVKEGLKLNNVRKFKNCRSSFSSVYVDRYGERQIVNFLDSKLPESASWLHDIEEHKAYLADTRWINGAIETLKIAQKFKRPGVLDAEDNVTQESVELASHVAFSLPGLECFTRESDLKKALIQVKNFTKAWVCVTAGDRGVFFLDKNELENIPSAQVQVKDTLGAGDVWHGAFTLSLAKGKKELDAVRFANSTASLKCTAFGGRDSFPTLKQVQDFIKEQ